MMEILNHLLSPYAALAIPVLLLCVVLKRRYLSSVRDIPGPFVASFSTLWQVYHLWKGHIEIEMINLHRKHGDFVRISEKEVSVSHPDAVKLLLHAPIHKGEWYTIFAIPDYTYVNQMSECDPKEHTRKAKNVAPGYALSSIIKSEPQVDDLIRLLLSRLDETIQQNKPVEFNEWLTFFAFDVVGEVTFSQPFGFLKSGIDIRNSIAINRFLVFYVSVMGHYMWFHNATLGNPKLPVKPTSHLLDTTMLELDQRSKNPHVRRDMVSVWEDIQQQHPERMAKLDIVTAAIGNVGAGGDATSATLQALIYYLIRSPSHLTRLRQELDQAQQRGELSKIISYAEVHKLPFLQACIKETYRFHSPVGTGLPRVVPHEGLTIAGRFFKSGTVLSLNPWVIHSNPALFGSDADVFNPERWLDTERAKHMSSYLIHWGAGYNQCPGRNLAHFEVSKLGAQLIRDYDIWQVEPGKEWGFLNRFNHVQYGWPCYLAKRNVPGGGKV